MKRIFTILFFNLWTCVAFTQTTEDSLAELQSLLDSIPDISLAELGIDTTAEIVPDTLHLVIPASIASDTAYARTCLNQAIELIKAGKYDDAYAKADTAKHIYQMTVGYVSKEVADCLHQMGRGYGINNFFEKALSNFNKSIVVLLRIYGTKNEILGRSFYSIARTQQVKNNFELALFFYSKALKIGLNFSQSNLPLIKACYGNMGIIYNILGEYKISKKYFLNSIQIGLKYLGPFHPEIATSYNNLGVTLSDNGEFQSAIEYYEKALNIRKKSFGSNHPEVGSSYNSIGTFYSETKKIDKALQYFQKALEIQLVNNEIEEINGTYNNIGVIFYSKGNYKKAIEYHKKALNLKLNILRSDPLEVASSYLNLGNSLSGINEYSAALENYNRALNIRINSLGPIHPDVAQSFTSIASIYESLGNINHSIDFLQKALNIRISKLQPNHPEIATSFYNLGILYKKKEEYSKAVKYQNKAKTIRQRIFGDGHPFTLETMNQIIYNYQKQNYIDSSIFVINQAISGIKTQMSSDISSETKNLYQSQNIPIFESAIDVSLIKSKQDQHDSLKLKTYEYTELAKASLLQSQIKQTDALAFAGIPDSLLQKEYDLRIDINRREKQRQGLLEKGKTETDTTVLRISSIIFDLKREQETLFETLEKDYPEYYRLKYDTKTISLEDTRQKLLKDGQTMLEYFVGDSSIFIFVVRPDTFDVVQVKKDFPLDSLVRQMQSGLFGYYGQSADKRSDGLYKQSIQDYSDASHQLYQRIVAPVEQLLTQDLMIVPDGVLGYVPFEALLKSKPEKLNQFAAYPYMINDHTISYNFSATLWNEMKSKKHKKEPQKSLVAFAPFYEGSYTVLDSTINLVFDTLSDGRDTTIFQDVVSRKTYAPLPSSGIEAGTVSKMYKGDYFVNSDATEQKFYDIAGDYRFIHLSTHGVADARQGDYSYLAFAEQKDSIENEFLYVRDIYNTQLNADLVFLSACETAQGELQRGEGIISLARAFAYAGAKSIITTLWQVDDAATKDISIDFYKNLKKGFTKDVALQQAKLRHIKSAKSAQKHPFFWAAMIGIGDMGQVKN